MAGKVRHLIVGAGNAGISAARVLAARRPDDEIILFTKEDEAPYCRCLLTYFLEGRLSRKELFARGTREIAELRLDYRPGTEIVEVEIDNRTVVTAAGERIAGDTILVATGGEPKKPDFPGSEKAGIFTLRTIADAEAMARRIRPGGIWAVAGAGLVSLKTISALVARGVRVELFARSRQILSQVLDAEAAELAAARLAANGVTINTAEEITAAADTAGDRLRLTTSAGRELTVDALLYGKGVEAVSPVSREQWSGELSVAPRPWHQARHGLTTDAYLRIGEQVFAAGDTARVFDLTTRRLSRLALWPLAGEQGRIAGINLAAGAAAQPRPPLRRYFGGIACNSFSLFGLDFISAGFRVPPEEESEGWRTMRKKRGGSYRRLNFRENRLLGFILCGSKEVLEAGPLLNRIRCQALREI